MECSDNVGGRSSGYAAKAGSKTVRPHYERQEAGSPGEGEEEGWSNIHF